MYVLLGTSADPCCRLVDAALQAAGHSTLTTLNPLADDVVFSWTLTTEDSRSTIRWPDHDAVAHDALRGVFVRVAGASATPGDWTDRDRAYVQAETNAALVAWLRSLPCPVVNRPDADLWFHPHRSLFELHRLFDRCALPSLHTMIANDFDAARRFAEPYSGRVIYAPLTSTTRYPLATDEQWIELGKVIERVPVCLIEPTAGPQLWATVVGSEVFWSQKPDLLPSQLAHFDDGLRDLARELGVDWTQTEWSVGADGMACSGIVAYPHLDMYALDTQNAIANGIARLLIADRTVLHA